MQATYMYRQTRLRYHREINIPYSVSWNDNWQVQKVQSEKAYKV